MKEQHHLIRVRVPNVRGSGLCWLPVRWQEVKSVLVVFDIIQLHLETCAHHFDLLFFSPLFFLYAVNLLSISYCSSPLFNQINILPEPNTSLTCKHVCAGWISHINSLIRRLCKWAQRRYYGFCFGVFRWLHQWMQALVLLNMSFTVQTLNICQTW